MAANLMKAGHALILYDKRKETATELVSMGARWANTPRAVAQLSNMVFTSLPEPRDVEEVALGLNGIIEGGGKGLFYIDIRHHS